MNKKGFLTFESKTNLIEWYMENYYAKIAMGQKIYIEPNDGQKLIDEYLNRKNKSNDTLELQTQLIYFYS